MKSLLGRAAHTPATPFVVWKDKAEQTRTVVLLLVIIFLVVQGLGIYYHVSWRTLGEPVFFDRKTLIIDRVDDEDGGSEFEPGDRILEVNGIKVTTFLDYRRALNAQAPNAKTTLTIVRGETNLDLAALVETKPWDLALLLRNLVALAFLAMGALVIHQHPGVKVSRLFFLTGFTLGLYFALQTTEAVGLIYVQIVALTLTPGLAIHFFQTFPEEQRLVRKGRSPLFYVPSLILMALTLWTHGQAVAAGTGIYYARTYWRLITVNFGYLGLSAAIGLITLGYTYSITDKAIVKRQIQWIMWGLACAIITVIVDIALTRLRLQSPEANTLLLLGTLPLPVGFAFAILRYRLLDIDLVASRSVVYGLLTAGLAAIYLLFISLLSNALGVVAGSSSYTLIVFLSALLIGIVMNPLRARIQAIIDGIFFRRQLDFQHALIDWSRELATSLRFSDLGRLLLQEVPKQMLIERAWLLVLNKAESHLESLPMEDHTDRTAEDTQLTISSREPITSHLLHLGEFLLMGGEGNEQQAVIHQVPPAWSQTNVRTILPLVSGGTLVGIYLLGPKLSGDIYQRQELDLVRTLANQATVAIANARLYEEIHAFSQELEEKVRERTQELHDFVSVVYHELSTPITAIRGYTSLLLDGRGGGLTAKQIRYLETVRRNINRLMRLVGDLSDVAKIEDGRLTIRPEPLDLREAIKETINSLSSTVAEKDLEVLVDHDPATPKVLGDRQRVVQILTNLVSNACRYTPVGGQIEIRSNAVNGFAQTTVKDTGIGIHRDEIERIFERFYRSDDPLVQDQSGTGLGLSITQSLVALHGGEIWVESRVGQGSTFGFSLPAAEEVNES